VERIFRLFAGIDSKIVNEIRAIGNADLDGTIAVR
jgi:hypothetical protein